MITLNCQVGGYHPDPREPFGNVIVLWFDKIMAEAESSLASLMLI